VTFAEWADDERGLHREFRFDDFSAAWAFMTRVATLAESMNHHPDWSNSWNRVSITLISHDVGRVTERDRKLAEAIDGMVADGLEGVA
jgi:4a-hydroxytetrahydrobiopterin dehydratase